MSRISSTGVTTSTGLVSGIPIEDTVNQLIGVASQPRNTLVSRTNGLRSEQAAVDTLSSLVLGLKFSLNSFGLERTFASRNAKSSNETAVTVAVQQGASPSAGNYKLTPLQQATSHQIVSNSLGELGDALGSGDLNLRFGGRVNKGVQLADLNGGAGFEPGKLRITDRAGDTATIDLRAATTLDDVVEAINSNGDADVTASISGDQLVLTDNTGETGNFRVREVGSGTTAASLGLADLATTSGTLTGADVLRLGTATRLAALGGGLGVQVSSTEGVADLGITLKDGTTVAVDLSSARTLGDVLKAVNENTALAGKATLAVAADGNRLTLTDTTTGSGTTAVSGVSAGDLGLDRAASGGVVTGGRLIAGLGGVLLSSLNGGEGFKAGSIAITDRDNQTANVNLSSAETLDDVIAAINASSVEVTARVNDAGTGLLLTDDSGGSGSLSIAEVGAGKTAASLGLVTDDATESFDTGSLDRQSVGLQSKLSSLRGGQGIALGQVRITDSAGRSSTIDLRFTNNASPTLGDAIDKINASAVSVTASLNEAGDGLLLTDTAGGTGKLTVAEVAGGQTASQLRILGESSASDTQNRQVIDGTYQFSVDLAGLEEAAAQTRLSSLNGGEGVNRGLVKVTNSAGVDSFVDLASAATVQDVIDRFNTSATGVTAALNAAGTGIVLTDRAAGGGKLKVADFTGTAAEDLRLKGESGSSGTKTISGAGLLGSGEPLEVLAQRINDFDGGFTASVVFDGAGYRLSIASTTPGAANELVATAGGTSLRFTETSRATDAVALFGQGSSEGVAVSRADGTFNTLIDGVDVRVNQANGEQVSIDVTQNDDPLRQAVDSFVKSYNAVRTNLDTVTSFDAESNTTGILFGRNEAVRVDSELSRVISGRFTSGSKFTSLESIGVTLDDKGKLTLDTTKLNSALAQDRAGVERLFRDEKFGVVAKFTDATDRLAGEENSLLSARSISLTATIEANTDRVSELDLGLERQRERLLFEFFRLEESISLLQSNLSTISSIQPISLSFASS